MNFLNKHLAPHSSLISKGGTNRRIVLVALPPKGHNDSPFLLGHISLLAALQRAPALDVRSIVWPVGTDINDAPNAAKAILTEEMGALPGCIDVAIGAYVWNESFLVELLSLLRNLGFGGRIILGGPQITNAESGLEALYPEADIFVRGYAEDALTAISKHAGRIEFLGVHYAGDEDRCEQTKIDFANAVSPWLNGSQHLSEESAVRWETQRGCAFKCSFCQHRQQASKEILGHFPDHRIKREIELFCASGVRRISVVDPVFNYNSRRATEILREFKRQHFQGEICLQCRPEMVDEHFLEAAESLNVCLEFGLQSIHPKEYEAVGRSNNLKKVSQVLSSVAKKGIKHEVSLIFGLPEQTLATFKESVRWCQDHGVPIIKSFPLLLLRGTALERKREKWQLVVKPEWPIVVESSTFSRDEWEQMSAFAKEACFSHGNEDDAARLGISTGFRIDPPRIEWRNIALGREA